MKLRTTKDYKDALRQIDTLMDAEPGSPEGDELEELVSLVEEYEEESLDPPDED